MSKEPMDAATEAQFNEAVNRYHAAAHQLQTAIKALAHFEISDLSEIQLRFGINNSMVEHGALAHFLIKKGILTEVEYTTALADALEREVDLYKKKLEKYFPHGVNLDII